MSSTRRARYAVLACLLAVIVLRADVSLGGVIFESFNGVGTASITIAPNVNIPPSGGTFDMHVGAQVDFSIPPSAQVFHVPGQPAALSTFFPTKTTAMAAGAQITPNRKVNAQKNLIIKGGAVTFVTPPVPYVTTPKDFTRTIPISTNTAFRTGTHPKTQMTSTAEALAKLSLSTVNNAAVVNPVGSFSEFVRNGPIGNNGPNGMAGTLLRDPITFSNVPGGSLSSMIFSLDSTDFRVQSNEPTGLAAAEIQLGTDAFGSTGGSLGLDADGNPLLMQLDVDFMSSGDIFLQFQADSSLAQQTFFDPENGNAPISGDVAIFVATRLADALVFDPTTTTWTLSRNVALFGESFMVPNFEGTLNLDYTLAQEVLATPAPPTLVLFGLAIMLLVALAERRCRFQSNLRA